MKVFFFDFLDGMVRVQVYNHGEVALYWIVDVYLRKIDQRLFILNLNFKKVG